MTNSVMAEHLFKVGDSEYATIETKNVGVGEEGYAWDMGTAKDWSQGTPNTLSSAQWLYLLKDENNCKLVTLPAGNQGMVLYPKDWAEAKPGNRDNYSEEISDWDAMESKGARFLPAEDSGSAVYWTSTEVDNDKAEAFSFSSTGILSTAVSTDKTATHLVREAHLSSSCDCFTVTTH